MEKTMRNRIYVIILAFILFITSFFSMSFMTAKADDGSLNFYKTNVMDDLRSSKNFNILIYPFYESEEPEMFILNVVEYCYSFDVLRQGKYLARFIRLVKRYVDVEELTPEIINAFIDRIEIGKKEKVFDRKMQDITIVYNFVGAIDLPQYENY